MKKRPTTVSAKEVNCNNTSEKANTNSSDGAFNTYQDQGQSAAAEASTASMASSKGPEQIILDKIGQDQGVITLIEMFLNYIEHLTKGFFWDDDEEPYVIIERDGIQVYFPIKSPRFEQLMQYFYWKRFRQPLPSELFKIIRENYLARARFDESSLGLVSLENRIQGDDRHTIYSLGDPMWKAVAIDENGWRIVAEPPAFKKYPKIQRAQVIPISGGNIFDILDFFAVETPNHKTLLLVYIVYCFVAKAAKPLLYFFGSQGSAKSSASETIKKLIDPAVVNLGGLATSSRNIGVILNQSYVTVLDNLSDISREQSDLLCRAVTGGGMIRRKVKTDEDTIAFKLKNCLILNGINCEAKRPDLLDRAIIIEMQRIEEKRCIITADYNKKLAEKMPFLLGAIFDVLSRTFKIYPGIKLTSHPRMAEFARWGTAIAEAIGIGGQDFLNAYYENIQSHNVQVVEADPVTTCLAQFVNDQPEKTWAGRMSDLLKNLNQFNVKMGNNFKDTNWPKTPSHLSNVLSGLRVNLEGIGIKYKASRQSDGKHIEFWSSINEVPTSTSPLTTTELDMAETPTKIDASADVEQKSMVA